MDEIYKRKPEDYTLFATLIFCLQSTDSLATLGFENVPIYTPIPPPAKAPRAKTRPKAKKSQVDENDELEDDGAENGVGKDIEPNPADKIQSANKQKGLVLHGEVGGPARRAFLARGDTPEIESLPQVNPTKLITETMETVTENSFLAINDDKARVTSPIHKSPEFEPLTPPVSAKKPLPEKNNIQFAHRLTSGQTHSLPLGQHIPIDLNKLSPFSQATAALTQDKSSHLEVPGVQEPLVNIEKIIQDLKALSQESELARASSPALSEATEAADPMEIMESVRNSQRVSYGSYEIQDDYALSRQNDFHREGEEPATPTGSFSFLKSEKRKAEAMVGRSEYKEPRKTTVAPSMGKTSLEEKMIKAKAKLAAATERNRKLEEERQAAMVIKKENDEV
jgi:hypothetical protein